MAEKRKPCLVLLLKIEGKKRRTKIELFRGNQWRKSPRLFRVRVGGKWYPDLPGKNGREFMYISQFKELLFRSLKI